MRMKCNTKTYLDDIVVHAVAVVGDSIHAAAVVGDSIQAAAVLEDDIHTATVLEDDVHTAAVLEDDVHTAVVLGENFHAAAVLHEVWARSLAKGYGEAIAGCWFAVLILNEAPIVPMEMLAD